jgi:hypothetical protein
MIPFPFLLSLIESVWLIECVDSSREDGTAGSKSPVLGAGGMSVGGGGQEGGLMAVSSPSPLRGSLRRPMERRRFDRRAPPSGGLPPIQGLSDPFIPIAAPGHTFVSPHME